jgi:hypothetical protein
MAEEVPVTPSEVRAAQRIVERDSANGKETSEAIRKIAEAELPTDRANARVSLEPVKMKNRTRRSRAKPTKRSSRSERALEVLRLARKNLDEAEQDQSTPARREPG